MADFDKCTHFYIGCNTNKGKLVGVKNECLVVQDDDQNIIEYNYQCLGSTLFLYLQHIDDLTTAQRMELIKRGINIGRPSGYTFSNNAFVYLITLNVDLFGLINSGHAKNISDI